MSALLHLAQAQVRIGPEEGGYRVGIADFTVRPGEVVLIAGPSGSGKSLFLELAGLARRPEYAAAFTMASSVHGAAPTDVAALWSREDVARLAQMRVHALGFMVPSSLLASHTVRQNLALSARIAGAPLDIGLDWALRLGLGALLDRRPGELSFGQRHRAVLARALASDPQCLIADEPTGPLDSAHSAELAQCLVEFAHGSQRAVIVASHEEPLFADIAAQTYRVCESGGSAGRAGSHAELVREAA